MVKNEKSKDLINKAVEITDIDYHQYGILYNLSGSGQDIGNVNHSFGPGWEDADTAIPLLDTQGSLGYTLGSGTPFAVEEMERHLHTQEAQIPIVQPIVFCVAKADTDVPKAEDVVPVILRPGYIFVLDRGIWHSSSHGLFGKTRYYWTALVFENEPTEWRKIEGGPVRIEAPLAAL